MVLRTRNTTRRSDPPHTGARVTRRTDLPSPRAVVLAAQPSHVFVASQRGGNFALSNNGAAPSPADA